MIEDHFGALQAAARQVLAFAPTINAWGLQLASVLPAGHRLLACGNGGSAAEAQHLTGEFVGRFDGDRRPFSAIALHADTSAGTAILNDYGADELFARQVRAHGRPGDILIALSTSGQSSNVLAAVREARRQGLISWALTGPGDNPLSRLADDAITVDAPRTATVQEIHLAIIHALCRVFDDKISTLPPSDAQSDTQSNAQSDGQSDARPADPEPVLAGIRDTGSRRIE